MSPDDLMILAGGIIASGTGGSIVTALLHRKRTAAETADIITQAAAQAVDAQSGTIESLSSRVSKVTAHLERMQRQHDADRDASMRHTAWDRTARARLQEAGIVLPEPPPLYAPDVS